MRTNAQRLYIQNRRLARKTWPDLKPVLLSALQKYSLQFGLSIAGSELILISGNWYVTHAGLLAVATRRRCRGIEVEAVSHLCDLAQGRFVFKATAYTSHKSRQFVGYGDADPSNGLQRNPDQHLHRNRLIVELRRPEHPFAECLHDGLNFFITRTSMQTSASEKSGLTFLSHPYYEFCSVHNGTALETFMA